MSRGEAGGSRPGDSTAFQRSSKLPRGRRRGAVAGSGSDFLGFDLEELLPGGGYVCMLKAYFDESKREDGTFCVAGFVFPRGRAVEFQAEWRAMLAGRSAFHTTDVVCGAKPFDGLTRDERTALLDRAIQIIAKTARVGVIVACDLAEITPILPLVRGFNKAYPLCAHCCLAAVGSDLEKSKRTDLVSFIFEQGDASQGDADALMNIARRDPALRHAYHYHSHAFAGKTEALPLQAADLLAWEYSRYRSRRQKARTERTRQEFITLVMSKRISYKYLYLRPDSKPLLDYLARIRELIPPVTPPSEPPADSTASE